MSNDDTHRLRRTAYHESGHALIAEALGLRVLEASVIPDFETYGHVRFAHAGADMLPAHRIAISLAGPVAERWLESSSRFLPGLGSDMKNVQAVLARHKLNARSPEYREAMLLTGRLLKNNWGAVAHLADWLIQHRRATGTLIREIFNTAQIKRGMAC